MKQIQMVRAGLEPGTSGPALWAQLLEAWLALSGVKYHDNL